MDPSLTRKLNHQRRKKEATPISYQLAKEQADYQNQSATNQPRGISIISEIEGRRKIQRSHKRNIYPTGRKEIYKSSIFNISIRPKKDSRIPQKEHLSIWKKRDARYLQSSIFKISIVDLS
ncbi:hypothetical protein HAX54_032518 [Datura stramonium]|uniref:Uncharacterized protein n=1 Tax=Datura stramonium TaxID=4076 RepID=A0ABS8VDE7_DATST|nr:hypothetical protein [Datura stramonium]